MNDFVIIQGGTVDAVIVKDGAQLPVIMGTPDAASVAALVTGAQTSATTATAQAEQAVP